MAVEMGAYLWSLDRGRESARDPAFRVLIISAVPLTFTFKSITTCTRTELALVRRPFNQKDH